MGLKRENSFIRYSEILEITVLWIKSYGSADKLKGDVTFSRGSINAWLFDILAANTVDGCSMTGVSYRPLN